MRTGKALFMFCSAGQYHGRLSEFHVKYALGGAMAANVDGLC